MLCTQKELPQGGQLEELAMDLKWVQGAIYVESAPRIHAHASRDAGDAHNMDQ
jgi:hypothetical protein